LGQEQAHETLVVGAQAIAFPSLSRLFTFIAYF
jgi:hypothetical protein